MILAANNISFFYHSLTERVVEVFIESTVSIEPGEVVCVVGESGSGKTTLLNLLAGVLQPTYGEVVRVGVVTSYLQQDDTLLPFRTVWQNCCLAAELRNQLTQALLDDGSAMLRTMRLGDYSDSLPSELSGGMRRRVALARQLLPRSNVLLLDEPFGAQDRATRQLLEDTVHSQCQNTDTAAVIVTHDIDSAVALADRILLTGAAKRIDRGWSRPKEFKGLPPSGRRAHVSFADHVSEVWRNLWEASNRG